MDCYKEERLKLLEERNERLFRAIGRLEPDVRDNPNASMTLKDVLRLLNYIEGKEANRSCTIMFAIS
mgnify:FL=1